ncbi:hypothetical protein G6W41_07055 [Campylobacter concisus]|uniref:hypothetical protein n=1 Tax=Campylobacter concisus TaxID=199 RepID=UPI0018845EA8|nr:hypothetical protein [Campylobacter concisus]MBE9863866.1 hypothetical protein [Campylobacter concisus]
MGRFWDIFINGLIEITIKSGSPLLYWVLFDVVGLASFSIFLSMIVFDLCCFIKYGSIEYFNKNTIISSIFVSAIFGVFCFLYINYSYGTLRYVANFSLFLAGAVLVRTIYKEVKAMSRNYDNTTRTKPKFFRMSRSKRRKENLKNNTRK